jgi:hypothetical protein
MTVVRVFRSAAVAGVLAVVCVRWGVGGAILGVAACIVALMLLPRATGEPIQVTQPILRGFLPWFVCTGWFAVFTVALAPWAELPTYPIALLILSPVVGMMVLGIESAVGALLGHCSAR